MALKLYKENGEVKPSYEYADDGTPPSGYTDVTEDLTEWHKVKNSEAERDYLFRVGEMRRIVKALGSGDEETGFNTLNAAEKLICCEHIIGTQAQRQAIVGESGIINYAMQFGTLGFESRQMRVAVIFAKIGFELTIADENDLKYDGVSENLNDSYTIFGICGSINGESDGVYDWFKGLGMYTGIGIIDKGYTPLTMTLSQLIDYCVDVLCNGNYTLP